MHLPFQMLALQLHIHEHVYHWMERYGYFALFGVLFACGLGLPVPEDIPLVIAGIFVAHGKMHLAIAAVCAWLGIVGGDIVLYHLGKSLGLEIKRIPIIGHHISTRRIDYLHRMFERYGIGVVAVGRMFAGVRGTMVFVAGTIRFTLWKFILVDGLAAIVSGGLFLMLGYWFGSNTELLRRYVHEGKKWTLLLAAIGVVGLGIWIYLRQKKANQGVAESEEPPTPAPLPESSPAESGS
jgi:membrane protein DedA with SNARE-associated domain